MSREDRLFGEVPPDGERRGESSVIRVRIVCRGNSGNQDSI